MSQLVQPSAASQCEVPTTPATATGTPSSDATAPSSIEQRLAAAGWKLESKPSEDKSPLHSRAPNSFILYRADKAREIAMLHPNVNQSAISRMVADLWKQEPPAIKEKYRQRQLEEKKRFNERMKDKLASFDRTMPNRRKRKAAAAGVVSSSSAKGGSSPFVRFRASDSASPSDSGNSPSLRSSSTMPLLNTATQGRHQHTSSTSSVPNLPLSQYQMDINGGTSPAAMTPTMSTSINGNVTPSWNHSPSVPQSAFPFDFKRPNFAPPNGTNLRHQDMEGDWSRRFSISSSAPNSPLGRDLGEDNVPAARAATPLVMFEDPSNNSSSRVQDSQKRSRDSNVPTTSIQNLLCDPLSRRQSLAVGMDVFLPNAPPAELQPTINEAMDVAKVKANDAQHVSVPSGNQPICIPCPSNGTLVLTNVPQNCVIYIQPR